MPAPPSSGRKKQVAQPGISPKKEDVIDLGDIDKPTSQPTKEQVSQKKPLETSVQTGNFVQSIPAVAEMQKELINVALDISSHPMHNSQSSTNRKGELIAGADPFSKFLVENYVNEAKPTGQQYVNTELKQPLRSETGKQNDNFQGILKTIQQIGSAGSGQEQKPDGIWGKRTNNALNQVYSLAYAMFKMQSDMGYASSNYSDKDLNDFKSNLVDGEKLSNQQKSEAAQKLLANLKKFRAYYDSFRERVLDNPQTNALITQKSPVLTQTNKQKDHTEALGGPQGKALFDSVKNQPIEVELNDKKVIITPSDLQTASAFKAFLSRQSDALTPEQQEQIKKNDPGANLLIGSILTRINSQLV